MSVGRYLTAATLAVAFASATLAGSTTRIYQPPETNEQVSSNSGTVNALKEKIAQQPDNDVLFSELSKAYAASGNKEAALKSIKSALKLKPDKLEYLRSGAKLASWNGDYKYSLELYSRILKIKPEDKSALLGLARAENWSGEIDCSARHYESYVDKYPKDKKARLEYARVITWRGGYADAMDILDGYLRDFGADDDYERLKATVLALARRSRDSLAISGPMLKENPEDYGLLYARTIALANGRRPQEALASLNQMETLRPLDNLTRNTALYVRTPLRSTLAGGIGYSHDSDALDIWSYSLSTRLKLSPVTFISAGGRWEDLSAKAGSGLERLDGGTDSWMRSGWLGASHRFSSYTSADLTIGGSEIRGGNSILTYNAGLNLNPTDTLFMRISRSRDYYAISPRALSWDVRQTSNRLDLSTDMGFRYHLDASGAYDTFSDGNRRWDLAVAPRREIARTGSFNFDLGLRGWWFGFKDNFGHGYYAPSQYQRYAVMGFGYWKIDDNDGIGFVLAPGYFKDNTMGHFKFGFDASLQGTFGIYRDWMLQVSISRVHNNRIASGAYQGTTAQISLVRRF